jgi:hypothetical protein
VHFTATVLLHRLLPPPPPPPLLMLLMLPANAALHNAYYIYYLNTLCY